MATVGEGKTVLIIVDTQVGVMSKVWDRQRVTSNAAAVVKNARQSGVPVVWVQHADEELPTGSPEWQWTPELVPEQKEPVIPKHHHSSFEQTKLPRTLAKMGISHIFLAGAATNWCIRATAYGALSRGYDLTIVKDAHSTGSMELEGKTIKASDIIDELNTVLSRLSYPGCTTDAVTAREIRFLST